MKKTIIVIILIIVGILIGVSIYGSFHNFDKEPTASSESAFSEQKLVPVLIKSASGDTDILNDLLLSFDSGSLVSQIRSQDQLDKYWEENPPTVEDLTSLIKHRGTPESFRIYITKILRNKVKMHIFSDEEKFIAFADIRNLIADDNETNMFRASIADILTTVDSSDESILVIIPLLDSNDDVAVVAVSALLHTTNLLAVEALYNLVVDDKNLMETKPRTLMKTLPALSTTEKNMISVVNNILDKSSNFDFYHIAIISLINTPSSVDVLESIAKAFTVAPRFGDRQIQAENLCRVAVQKHSIFFRSVKNELDSATLKIIEELL